MKWWEEHLSFPLPKRRRFARRKRLSVSKMNGETMLLYQDIGFWRDLVAEKMQGSRFLVRTERDSFTDLIENSTMPVFTADFFQNSAQSRASGEDRVTVPITEPEFNVSYDLVCNRANLSKWRTLFRPSDL